MTYLVLNIKIKAEAFCFCQYKEDLSMLVNKEEIRKLMKQGKLSNQEDLNSIFRSMIKDAIETIYVYRPGSFPQTV